MDAAEKTERQLDSIMAQLDRIELQNAEILAFRDLLMETAAPFLKGGKSSVWLAMLAKSKGRST